MLHIEDIESYGANWQTWYMSILPNSRVGQRHWPPLKQALKDLRDWKDLMKGSKQGVVMLLLSLSWWDAQATKKKERSMVSSALQDIVFVVRQLAANLSDDTSVLHKRARCPEPVPRPLKR